MLLRKINPLEVNKQIGHLPDNIYGYNYGHHFCNISKNSGNDFSKLIIGKRNPGEGERRFFFEVRKYSSTDVRLVGYISDETQLNYNGKGLTESEMIIFPQEYEDYKNLIEIQLINNPLKISDRSIELDDIGELTILEISKLPTEVNANKTNSLMSRKTLYQGGDETTKESLFVQQILLHKYWAPFFVFLFILVIYLIFGVSPKDLMP